MLGLLVEKVAANIQTALALQLALDLVLLVIIGALLLRLSKQRRQTDRLSELVATAVEESERGFQQIMGTVEDLEKRLGQLQRRAKLSALAQGGLAQDRMDEETTASMAAPDQIVKFPRRTSGLDRRYQVMTLLKRGLPMDEISRRLNIPYGEIELMIEMIKHNTAPPEKAAM